VADLISPGFAFYYFNRVSYSGTTLAGGFSPNAAMERFTESSIDRLLPMPLALNHAYISNFDYYSVIFAPGTEVFIFLDPPYVTAKKLYGDKGKLHELDHDELALRLRGCRHRFLMTLDDCPRVRELYSWAKIEPFDVQYGMDNCGKTKKCKNAKELLISNYR
jgi:DNA adenine methylase